MLALLYLHTSQVHQRNPFCEFTRSKAFFLIASWYNKEVIILLFCIGEIIFNWETTVALLCWHFSKIHQLLFTFLQSIIVRCLPLSPRLKRIKGENVALMFALLSASNVGLRYSHNTISTILSWIELPLVEIHMPLNCHWTAIELPLSCHWDADLGLCGVIANNASLLLLLRWGDSYHTFESFFNARNKNFNDLVSL